MNCPVCTATSLLMTERSGIEIDYCPTCRGVWLDRGELDKLIERAAAASAPLPPPTPPTPVPAAAYPPAAATHPTRGDGRFDDDDDDDDDDRRHRHDGYGKFGGKRRKKGLLGELFDF